jgi:hypothetical protein
MDFPQKIRIMEVGPRDGFQSLKPWIETPVKVKVVSMLLDAGVNLMEATSFISPKAIPQMQDADAVIAAIRPHADMSKIFALIGNEKGAVRAHEAGVKKLTVVISASEAHNMSNVRKTPAESLEQLEAILREYPDTDGLKTGWVAKGGYHIVATAKRGNTRLIAVVMGAKSPSIRAREAEKLLDEGFRMVREDPLLNRPVLSEDGPTAYGRVVSESRRSSRADSGSRS